MGMPVSVHIRATEPTRVDIAAAAAAVFAHLRKVDEVLSTWRTDSHLLRLQHGTATTDELHPWLADVTLLCLEAEDRTDGLFSAWRARPAGRTVFDPTGLVKGWAVAAASAHLETVPEIAYSIGAGGDVVVGTGTGVDEAPPWRIGIEDPRQRGGLARVVTVTRGAVATSGAAIRGGHVVDPRTGQGIVRPGSATVVGPDLMWADVWATAAWVDPERARAPHRAARPRLRAHRDLSAAPRASVSVTGRSQTKPRHT
jgi:thiamine biosynthesis lipoprotein